MFASVPVACPNLRATAFSKGSCVFTFRAIETPIAAAFRSRFSIPIMDEIPALGRDCTCTHLERSHRTTELILYFTGLVAAGSVKVGRNSVCNHNRWFWLQFVRPDSWEKGSSAG